MSSTSIIVKQSQQAFILIITQEFSFDDDNDNFRKVRRFILIQTYNYFFWGGGAIYASTHSCIPFVPSWNFLRKIISVLLAIEHWANSIHVVRQKFQRLAINNVYEMYTWQVGIMIKFLHVFVCEMRLGSIQTRSKCYRNFNYSEQTHIYFSCVMPFLFSREILFRFQVVSSASAALFFVHMFLCWFSEYVCSIF